MYLRRFLLQLIRLVISLGLAVIPSVSAVCRYSIAHQNNLYNYNLAASSKEFPHGALSEDGYYKVSSNGTVVWFQLCRSMIFNHDPPRCFDCLECGGSARCGMGCSALMSNNINGYPLCTTIGGTPTITTDIIDIKSPHMGLIVKMWHNGIVNCSLSVSVVCDSKQVQGPTTLEKVGLCDYVTQLRHPSGCAQTVSSNNNSSLGWFGTLLIIILGLFGAYLIAGAAYRFFHLGIRGIDIIPNLEFWASLPHRAQSALMSVVRRCRGPSEGYRVSYSSVDF